MASWHAAGVPIATPVSCFQLVSPKSKVSLFIIRSRASMTAVSGNGVFLLLKILSLSISVCIQLLSFSLAYFVHMFYF